jgi:hypothetical protein
MTMKFIWAATDPKNTRAILILQQDVLPSCLVQANLPAEIRKGQEKKLAALKEEMRDKERKEKERKFALKYHKVNPQHAAAAAGSICMC